MGLPIELPPCDPAALAQVVEAIPQVRHDDQPYIAAAGFGEACRGPTATSAAAWARAMTGT
ncbi:MAG TPA: hypothetical protein PKA64_26905, partial [Myxococcota bacterium]|nr:hypothetical protein [Myxococcota bacterium]